MIKYDEYMLDIWWMLDDGGVKDEQEMNNGWAIDWRKGKEEYRSLGFHCLAFIRLQELLN